MSEIVARGNELSLTFTLLLNRRSSIPYEMELESRIGCKITPS